MAGTQEEDGLAQLLEDVLSAGPIEPDLLLRYAEDARALEPEERARVEAYLASSPAAADQVRVLRNFDPAELLAPEPSKAVELAGSVVSRLRSLFDAPLRIAVPAAAALALLLVFSNRGPESPAGHVAGTEPSLAAAPEKGTPQDLAPAGAENDLLLADVDAEPDDSTADLVAQLPLPAPPAESSQPIASRPIEEEKTPAPGTTESLPAPSRLAERDDTREPTDSGSALVVGEEILLAYLDPAYATPEHLLARIRESGSMRSGPRDTPRSTALAPDHVAQTARATPVLYWHLTELPAPTSPGSFRFSLVDQERIETIVDELELAGPAQAGFQMLDLAKLDVELAPGIEYVWWIEWRSDSKPSAAGVVSAGWIQRTPSVPRVASSATAPHDLAAAGLWYDAFDRNEAMLRAHPGDERLLAGRAALIRAANLDPLALR